MSGTALYRALISAGADEDVAREAADEVEELVVKHDLELILKAALAEQKADIFKWMAEQKADILKWMVGAMIAQAGLIVALIKLI